MEHTLLLYRSRNLGDIMQSLALSRLLPPCKGIFRHRLQTLSPGESLIVNGMFDKDRPPAFGAECLFAGVSGPHFRRSFYLRWMAQSPFPIGARDPATADTAKAIGLNASLIGCATLTLPPYDGPRKGIYSVDTRGPGVALSQTITRRWTVEEQWTGAITALDKFRTAEAVYTSRLHVALPCLAFGTPVWIANPATHAWHPSRFGLLEAMGIPWESLTTADVSPWARRYTQFLETHLQMPIVPGTPKLPATTYRPSSWIPEWWRW